MVINKTPAGTDFADLPRAVVIYISVADIFREGRMFYETVKVDRESKNARRSPVAEFYVNTENLENEAKGTEERLRRIAALMKVFRDPNWYDDQFPAFSRRKKELHETEKGVENVSKEMQMLIDEVRQEERKELEQKEKEWQRERRELQRIIEDLNKKLSIAQPGS